MGLALGFSVNITANMNPAKPLTAKQTRFVQNVVSGLSLADSYRCAYNSGGRSATVRVEASGLTKQPHIAAAILNQRLAAEREQLRFLRNLSEKIGW